MIGYINTWTHELTSQQIDESMNQCQDHGQMNKWINE